LLRTFVPPLIDHFSVQTAGKMGRFGTFTESTSVFLNSLFPHDA
jgi:hypothetical protein